MQIVVYNGAVSLWQTVRRELAAAIELKGGVGSGGGGNVWRVYWYGPFRCVVLMLVAPASSFLHSVLTPVQVSPAEVFQVARCLVEDTNGD
jgi:hypothetical protein